MNSRDVKKECINAPSSRSSELSASSNGLNQIRKHLPRLGFTPQDLFLNPCIYDRICVYKGAECLPFGQSSQQDNGFSTLRVYFTSSQTSPGRQQPRWLASETTR
ncbi:hypothetical protein PTI98_006130 [Pleurotus ostreatus]|nr:hypothetical protein PTI98_006130 [Pleurotus ostreatus]